MITANADCIVSFSSIIRMIFEKIETAASLDGWDWDSLYPSEPLFDSIGPRVWAYELKLL